MTTLVCDIEANGFKPDKIHCIVTMDYATEDITAYCSNTSSDFADVCYKYNAKMKSLLSFDEALVDTVDMWIGHNFIKYDRPAIKSCLGVNIKLSRITDTLIMSRKQKYSGRTRHSLEAFADIIQDTGYVKLPDPESWDEFTPYMLERCIEDTRLNYRVAQYLKSESAKLGSEVSLKLAQNTNAILIKMQENGFALNVDKADKLRTKLKNRADSLELKLMAVAPPVLKREKTVGNQGECTPRYNKKGILIKDGHERRFGEDYESILAGPYSAIRFDDFDLGSQQQKVLWLEPYWTPKTRTKGYRNLFDKLRAGEINQEQLDKRQRTMWALDEDNLATVSDDAPEAMKYLAEFAMLTSRVGEIDGWFNALGEDNRVHGTVMFPGTITHRASHNNPNMANIPGLNSPYGGECRECFTVDDPTKNVLVGTDASGIQMRLLAHHLNDSDYANTVCTGDVHTRHLGYVQDILQYEIPDLSDSGGPSPRARVKTFIYAWVLGCGIEKTGLIFGVPYADGKAIKTQFETKVPGLQDYLKRLKSTTAQYGYYRGLDGGTAEVKGAHYALSVVLQYDETVIMEQAMIYWHNALHKHQVPFKLVNWVHDEWQTECPKSTEGTDDVPFMVGSQQVASIVEAGKRYNLNVPLDGEYKVGTTWKETH